MESSRKDDNEWLQRLEPVALVKDQAIFFISEDGIIRSWNLGVEQIFGYEKEEFVGLPGAWIFTPEDKLAGAVEREMTLAATEGWANDERWHVKKSGARFWARGSLTPVKNRAGEIVGFVKHLRDATNERQSRQELEAREERFRAIVETANEAILMLDGEGRIQFCNSQFADMVGELHASLTDKRLVDYIEEADDEVLHRCFLHTELCGREQHEICLKASDSAEAKWVLASVSPLASNGGGLLCFLTDISEAREATESLRLSEARFRALVENSSGAISVITPDGNIIYSSPALGRSLGYQPDELKTINKFDLLHPNDREGVLESFQRLASSPGHTITREYRIRRSDGSYAWREGVATNLVHDPAVRAIIINSRDVTEKKMAEQLAQEALSLVSEEKLSAEEASREKNAYLGSMSHEIRTPLNAIIGYAELMMEQDTDELPESFRRDLDRIVTAGRHLLDLVTGILDISKIEAGKMDVTIEEVDLLQLVQSTAETSQALVRRNRNQLHVQLPADNIMLDTDALKLRQVLLNLLSNAAKFTMDGNIYLDVQPTTQGGKPWVRLVVRDTGSGMTRQQIATLFEPYNSTSASHRQDGTGLGLVLTRRYCQLLGGDLTVESAPGQGAIFSVSIPLSPSDT